MSEPTETPDPEVQAYLDAQAAEYGQYVAAQNITYDGALAYIAGTPVPVSNVKKHGYLANGLVITAEQAAAERAAAAKAAEQADAERQAETDAQWAAATAPPSKKPSDPPAPVGDTEPKKG